MLLYNEVAIICFRCLRSTAQDLGMVEFPEPQTTTPKLSSTDQSRSSTSLWSDDSDSSSDDDNDDPAINPLSEAKTSTDLILDQLNDLVLASRNSYSKRFEKADRQFVPKHRVDLRRRLETELVDVGHAYIRDSETLGQC